MYVCVYVYPCMYFFRNVSTQSQFSFSRRLLMLLESICYACMHVRMCVCICMYLCFPKCVTQSQFSFFPEIAQITWKHQLFVYVCTYVCMYMHVCILNSAFSRRVLKLLESISYACMYTRIYVCMYVCMYGRYVHIIVWYVCMHVFSPKFLTKFQFSFFPEPDQDTLISSSVYVWMYEYMYVCMYVCTFLSM